MADSVSWRERFPVAFGVMFRRREGADDPVEVNKRKRGFGQVSLNDPSSGILLLPRLDNGIAKLSRNRVIPPEGRH
jgi:hypothetical protein